MLEEYMIATLLVATVGKTITGTVSHFTGALVRRKAAKSAKRAADKSTADLELIQPELALSVEEKAELMKNPLFMSALLRAHALQTK
jgi:hypothetical protein